MKFKNLLNYRHFHHRSVYLKLFLLLVFSFFAAILLFSLLDTPDATRTRMMRYESLADFIISNIGGLLAALILGLLLIILTKRLLFSQRLQGPLGNLQDEIRRITAGDFSSVALRDAPVPLSEELDQMTSAIEDRFRKLRYIQEELQRILFDLEKMRVNSSLGRGYLEERITSMQQQIQSIDTLLSPLILTERKPIPRLLIIGSGGREAAITLQAAHAPSVQKIYAIPGNPGIARHAECYRWPLKPPFSRIVDFAVQEKIDLVFIGPEQPLAAGLADELREAGIRVFGPGRNGALLEASKLHAKKLMQKYRVPSAPFHAFTAGAEPEKAIAAALEALDKMPPPWVIKADGLAAGKGVTVTADRSAAEQTVRGMLDGTLFGEAGKTILLEQFLEGEEISLQMITDKTAMLPLLPAQDYKRLLENNEGPNTGGMGAYAPTPLYTPEVDRLVSRKIVRRLRRMLRKEKIDYRGVLYIGLKLTPEGPRVVELNCRLGDPEAQAVLPLLRNDLFELALAAAENRLHTMQVRFHRRYAACVIIAAPGYPDKPLTGTPVNGLDSIPPDLLVYHAGTGIAPDGTVTTAGGRVLGITAIQQTLGSAVTRCYEGVRQLHFDGMQYRRDIGGQGMVLEQLEQNPFAVGEADS